MRAALPNLSDLLAGGIQAALFAALLLSGSAALAQEARERIEIGLSTERIAITSEFSGADLTIFGALDNVDPLVMYRGRYDVIVTLHSSSRATSLTMAKPRPTPRRFAPCVSTW